LQLRLRDFHPLGTKDLRHSTPEMYLELHFSPVLDHRPYIVVILRLEHDHVGRVTAERPEETDGFQTGRPCALIQFLKTKVPGSFTARQMAL
jgi:hypothetical protein